MLLQKSFQPIYISLFLLTPFTTLPEMGHNYYDQNNQNGMKRFLKLHFFSFCVNIHLFFPINLLIKQQALFFQKGHQHKINFKPGQKKYYTLRANVQSSTFRLFQNIVPTWFFNSKYRAQYSPESWM